MSGSPDNRSVKSAKSEGTGKTSINVKVPSATEQVRTLNWFQVIRRIILS